LNSLRYKFADRLPKIRKELYDELRQRNFVRTSPETVRNRYTVLGFLILGLAFFGFFGVGALFGDAYTFVVCLPVAFGLFGIFMLITARVMPAKTAKGAEASAKWLAFKTYLREIDRYSNLEESKDAFEKYLAYAIVFGLERSFIRRFSSVPGTPIPPWYFPHPYRYPGGVGGTRGGTTSTGAGGMPTLEGMSGGLTGGLESMSSGLTRMLTNTQTVLQSQRSSSGSSGGGFGGGFSGGFSGGSSGGGSRGFG
jgi:uncharacterized membrane protein